MAARARQTQTSEVERTADGRYLIINGRRWRASDPNIPASLAKELVAELMAARRLVRTHPMSARPRVQDAKIALGERGALWWENSTSKQRATRLAAAARALLRHRKPEATICPSDIARIVGGKSWRSIMDEARDVAAQLSADGVVRVLQGGLCVDIQSARGPIRLGRGPKWEG